MNKKDHPLYQTWLRMCQRCSNPNRPNYKYYGGRGISVSQEWLDFSNFTKDMGEKPEGKSLDRVNNDLGYSKDNCKWSTIEEQNSKKRESSLYRNNTSGVKNIYFRKGRGYYVVYGWNSGKRFIIGKEKSLELAIKMRDSFND